MVTITLPDVDTLSFDSLEIACEDGNCPHPAVVLSKGCSDDRHYAVCAKHLARLKRWFADHRYCRCECGRPFIYLELHYDIVEV